MKGEVKSYKLGDRTIWDLREAMNGKYEDQGLNENDVIIMSEKKLYRVIKKYGQGATFRKMTINEIEELKQEVESANMDMRGQIRSEQMKSKIMKGISHYSKSNYLLKHKGGSN